MKFDMNIKTKLTVSIGVLVAMIVLLVSLSVTNLQILTATEPDSPAAEPGMNRALTWIMIIGGICICIGLWILFKIPNSINSPFKSLVKGILEIANHNYDAKLDLRGDKELEEVSKNFNRMAKRLKDYHNSTISDLMASKRYLETIINSINEPIVGLDNEQIILFINNEALNILNLKREDVIRKSAQEIAMRNDLLRRLICGMWEDKKKEFEFVTKDGRCFRKMVTDLIYAEVRGHTLELYCNDGVYNVKGTLSELEQRLHQYDFVQPYKGFLVNCGYIDMLGQRELHLKTEDRKVIPLSRYKATEIRSMFIKYINS